jgi:flagellin-specific chaperone FliS
MEIKEIFRELNKLLNPKAMEELNRLLNSLYQKVSDLEKSRNNWKKKARGKNEK